ncbi:MAG: hypothetical protein EOM44_14025 [Bacteroidia bacterium]|nr:hypothetical protein [Bacteroidia bacterium]
MKIHYSAMFDDKEMSYHGEFEVTATHKQIQANIPRVTSVAIGKCKEKCEQEFNIKFEAMRFFEVYYYHEKKEVLIFKKVKEV